MMSPPTFRRAPRFHTVALLVALSTPALAQSDQPTLDDLLDLTPPTDTTDTTDTQSDPGVPTSVDMSDPETGPNLDLDDLLSPAQAADQFEQAIHEMQTASLRLGGSDGSPDAGLETQRIQEDILKKLDAVLAAAEQQQQKQKSTSSGSSSGQPGEPGEGSPRPADSGGQNASRPQPGKGDATTPGDNADQPGKEGDDPSAKSGEGKTSNPADNAGPGSTTEPNPHQPLSELRTEWGNLPPRLRDQVTEGLSEPFSPVYQRITERYYRLLAGEEDTPSEN